jgi:predicted metal-dependent phosphoesterase TrpH
MVAIDLHIHSLHSNDGELTVDDIIRSALGNGLEVISITDHNCVGAISRALEVTTSTGLRVIPGIEIDCSYEGTDLHLLGYNIDWKSKDFIRLEESIREKEMQAFPDMVRNLEKTGIQVDAEKVLLKAKGQPPSAELIAEVLLSDPRCQSNLLLHPYLNGGARSDMPFINFYLDYFAQGKPAYVKMDYMSFDEAVALVKRNGGIPVVAHPGANLRNREKVVFELLDQGAAGLEVFNNYHDFTQIGFFAEAVIQRSALMTCGSDFHGKNKPLIRLGSYKALPEYTEYLNLSIQSLLR